MKYKILILFFLVLHISVSAQDTISNKKKEHKFLYGVSIGTFYSPKVLSNDVFYNQKKISYSFNGGALYKFNDKIFIGANIGIFKFNYRFHYFFEYHYTYTDTVIFNIKVTCYNINIHANYNMITFKKTALYLQLGGNLLSGNRADIHYKTKAINYILPSSPDRRGPRGNYSIESGIGINYSIKKNSIITLSYIYNRYILNNCLLSLDRSDGYIDKNLVSLNLSYYFNF